MLWSSQGFRLTSRGTVANRRPAYQGGSLVNAEGFDRLTVYWRSLQERAGGAVPARAQFNPADVVPILPFIYLLERKRPDYIEVRLCGTALDEISGVSITGHNYLDVCPPEDRDLYMTVTHQTLAVPCAVRLTRDVTFLNGRTYQLTSLGFPLADADGLPRFSVGVMLSNRILRRQDMYNGAVLRSDLKNLEYIDIGYGTPKGGSADADKSVNPE